MGHVPTSRARGPVRTMVCWPIGQVIRSPRWSASKVTAAPVLFLMVNSAGVRPDHMPWGAPCM